MSTISPDFSKAIAHQKELYSIFFDRAKECNIKKITRGSSLTKLVRSAENVISVIERCNPIWSPYDGTRPDQATLVRARQWQFNNISEVKKLVAKAIVHKKEYYENHWLGKITRFILKFFNIWNNGFTTSIIKAEDFLLFWDSRVPVFKTANGNYTTRMFLTPISTPIDWLRDNLDMSNFYNYTPSRIVKFTGDNYTEALPSGFVRV